MEHRRTLPPLSALRAFEAAARLGSFAAAADELCVTASAISQQVKALEEWLGIELFRRLPRGLALSDRGRRYQAELGEAFDAVHRATLAVRRKDGPRSLTLSVVPSFAAHWLAPRLHGFTDRHPDIDVRISAVTRVIDFAVDDVDAAIRFGSGATPGLAADFLAEETVTPVCSPRLLAERPLRTPADLAGHTLLHDDAGSGLFPTLGWRHWLHAVGADIDASRGPGFSDNHLTLLAARAGRGVALGRLVLAQSELAAGELVAPLPPVLPTGLGYRLVYPPDRADDARIVAFRDWIIEELGRLPPWSADLQVRT